MSSSYSVSVLTAILLTYFVKCPPFCFAILRSNIRHAMGSSCYWHLTEHGDAAIAAWSRAAGGRISAAIHTTLRSRGTGLLLALHDYAVPALSGV